MPYMIRYMRKHRWAGETKPMPHASFTTDDSPIEIAKQRFMTDNPTATNVELFERDRPCPMSELPLIVPPEGIVVAADLPPTP